MTKPSELTPAERFIFNWQYGRLGHFSMSLIDVIKRADETNLRKLSEGYPHEVDGYMRYSREKGWWPDVERRGLALLKGEST